jgi:hypothetical protein
LLCYPDIDLKIIYADTLKKTAKDNKRYFILISLKLFVDAANS